MAAADLYVKRDAKVREHLQQYAPVWLVNEKHVPADESLIFEVLFQHHLYGWTNRRYLYDGFNNVLYHMGQVPASDDMIYTVTENEPWFSATVPDIVHAYGG